METDGVETEGPEITNNELYIQTLNKSNQAYFEYSHDINNFACFGNVVTVAFGKWTGDRLEFFCWNEKEERGISILIGLPMIMMGLRNKSIFNHPKNLKP